MDTKAWIRPYWHVDAKWFFGILFTLSLFVSLVTFSLARITSEKTIIPLASYFVASQFSRDGLDSTVDIEEFKRKNLKSGQNIFYPLPGQAVTITKQELETLSPRQLRLRIFEQVVTPIYKQSVTDESLKKFGLLAFLNYETNKLIYQIFLISLIPLLLTGIGLIGFSYRYGKLISPGVTLILIGFIPSVVLFLLQKTIPPQNTNGPLSNIPREVVEGVISSFSAAFYSVFILGIILIVIAFIAKAINKNK